MIVIGLEKNKLSVQDSKSKEVFHFVRGKINLQPTESASTDTTGSTSETPSATPIDEGDAVTLPEANQDPIVEPTLDPFVEPTLDPFEESNPFEAMGIPTILSLIHISEPTRPY